METIFFIDISVIILLLVIADLSKRIGEALQIPPLYRIFYVVAVLITISTFLDTIFGSFEVVTLTTQLIRAISLVTTIPLCMRYWKWLFTENIKR